MRGPEERERPGGGADLDAARVERLLSGPPPADGSALAGLLRAAAAPRRADELAGENLAVAAFHRARLAPRPDRRGHVARALVAKLVGVVVALLGAGWALAAAADVLPVPWEKPPQPPMVSAPAGSPSPGRPSSTATASPTPAASAATTGDPGEPTPSVDPVIRGLCQAFEAQDEDVALLSTPSFARLVDAAGGVESVPTFCRSLLGLPPAPTGTGG